MTPEQAARQAARQAAADRRAQRDADKRAKDAAKAYFGTRSDGAERLTALVVEREEAMRTILVRSLQYEPGAAFAGSLLRSFEPKTLDESPWTLGPPDPKWFAVPDPTLLQRLLPGWQARHAAVAAAAAERFTKARADYQRQETGRRETRELYSANEAKRRADFDRENLARMSIVREAASGQRAAVVRYYKALLDFCLTEDCDATFAEVGYSQESHHLVIDLELPPFSVIPTEDKFRYIKTGDRVEPVAKSAAKRKALYSGLICQVALKTIATVFRGAPGQGNVGTLTLNGMLDSIDPATGQKVRPCLLTVRLTDDIFHTLNLRAVEPLQCLRSLKASVSRSPDELVPVRPIIEMDMIDPRFVGTTDVLSSLETRPNLMDLTPNEFEGLITNLFSAMGLDTKQTRASRDGGVDCVAFDPRPVFGGKVVIQAKRYKNTVGVSAVRDLYGTMQNEGATKGLLVTTSGYGKAAYDFARGKPLELFDGGNLLHMLAEHANVQARIVMPEDWIDAPIHGE